MSKKRDDYIDDKNRATAIAEPPLLQDDDWDAPLETCIPVQDDTLVGPDGEASDWLIEGMNLTLNLSPVQLESLRDTVAAAKSAAAQNQRKEREPVGKKKPSLATPDLVIAVNFGGVSIGDENARVGIQVERERLNLMKADGYFSNRRLVGRIEVCSTDEHPDQGRLSGLENEIEAAVDGTFDVKGMSVNAKQISCGLTFALSEIDVGQLAKFAKRSGRLRVESAGEIPHGDEAGGDEDGEE